MSMVRNRSMMPPWRSWATLTAVWAAPNPAESRITPGTTYWTYSPPVSIAPPKR